MWELGIANIMNNTVKKVIVYIRQKIYDFFHPPLEDCLRDFGIVEPTITYEEAEKLLEMIREWEEREKIM